MCPHVYVRPFMYMGSVFIFETSDRPQFTIYPQLIGVWESERNACRYNSQSITLIFQLEADLYMNLSKRQDL